MFQAEILNINKNIFTFRLKHIFLYIFVHTYHHFKHLYLSLDHFGFIWVNNLIFFVANIG